MANENESEKVYLSLRAYSRHRGVALNAVQRAIKSNRIQVHIIDGKQKINRDEADAMWAANTDQNKISHAVILEKENPEALKEIKAETSELKTSGDIPELYDVESEEEFVRAAAEEEFNEDNFPISKSIRIERWFKAQDAKLTYEKKRGLLIEVDKVEQEFFKMARVTRDAILNIPNRISGECAAETNPQKVHEILTRAINDALEQLSNQRPTE